MGDSGAAVGACGHSTAPFVVVEAAWKGNSPGSWGANGEPVGADRMIVGATFEGEGMCISSVSFAVRPTRSGDRAWGASGLPFVIRDIAPVCLQPTFDLDVRFTTCFEAIQAHLQQAIGGPWCNNRDLGEVVVLLGP